MKAIQINHPRKDQRLAQVSLAEATGANLYHDAAGNTWAVSETGEGFYKPSLKEIARVPDSWVPGAANPIGGWSAEQ